MTGAGGISGEFEARSTAANGTVVGEIVITVSSGFVIYDRYRGDRWGNRRTLDGRNDVTVVAEIVITVSSGFVIYDRYRGDRWGIRRTLEGRNDVTVVGRW